MKKFDPATAAPNGEPPRYVAIKNYITDSIASGVYPPGSKVPTEREIAEMFGVSRITANKALKELSVSGVLKSIRGSGTYVRNQDSDSEVAAGAFVSALKFSPTDTSREHLVVSFRVIPCPTELKGDEAFKDSKELYEIILVNKDQDRRRESYDFTYIPVDYVSSETILPNINYLCTHFVYDFAKNKLGLAPKYLKIHVNTPIYSFIKQAVTIIRTETHNDSPLIWSTNICDENMELKCITYTIYPLLDSTLPLFTFTM